MLNIAERLTFFHDPGHGWLRVPLEQIVALGLHEEGCISRYSFIERWGTGNRAYAYLEEDLDAGVYTEARRTAGWPDAEEDSRHVHSFDRGRPRFGDPQFDEAFWNKYREVLHE